MWVVGCGWLLGVRGLPMAVPFYARSVYFAPKVLSCYFIAFYFI